MADGARGNGDGDHDAGGMAMTEGGDGGAHGGAGGQAVVDEDHGLAGDFDGRAVASVGLFTALELEALAGGDFFNLVMGDAEVEGYVRGDDLDAASGDGADGQLWDAGGAELANDPDIEGGVKGLGDLKGYWNAAAGEGEDCQVWGVGVRRELGR